MNLWAPGSISPVTMPCIPVADPARVSGRAKSVNLVFLAIMVISVILGLPIPPKTICLSNLRCFGPVSVFCLVMPKV